MTGALPRLLDGIIDYAGIFPPAKLAVPEATEKYLRYIHGPEKWIVSRFVCSVARLPELARELAEHPEEPFVPVAVVGSPSKNRHEWEHTLAHDAAAMSRFMEEADGHADIETYEIKAPDTDHLDAYANDLKNFQDVEVFVELPWGPAMDDSLALLAETQWLGAKGRTGGPEAASFPSSEALAGFLQQCAHLDLAFKLTAGLHHPLPRTDPATGARMHGFLNVVAALALAHAHDLSRRELQAVLEESDAAAFRFDEGVSWRGMEASPEDVDAVREVLVSFGSCSVEEPLSDLAQLGLLQEAAAR